MIKQQEGDMTAEAKLEENKRLVRAFIDAAFNEHQATRAAEYLTSDMKWHGGTLGRSKVGTISPR